MTALAAIGNRVVRTILESPLHGLLGSGLAVITVTGRRSGRPVSTPVNVSVEGTTFFVLSKRGRTWWRNLRGGAAASLRWRRQRIAVMGRVFEEDAAATTALTDFLRRNRGIARFVGVTLERDGSPRASDVETVARTHVVVELTRSPVDTRD